MDFAEHRTAIAYARAFSPNGDIAVEIYEFDRRRIAVLRHRLTIPTTSAFRQASSHHPMSDPKHPEHGEGTPSVGAQKITS